MDSVLKQGSKGNAVADLQQLLQRKGFYTGKIDGDFGSGTLNAVLKFQKANGLIADGIVGSASWKALRAVPASTQSPTVSSTTSSTTLPTLLPGSQGAAVTQAQQLLKAKGYYQGRIDGDFGVGTRDAIAAFQRANGLTVDGKVGEQTWAKLQAPAIAAVNSQPPITDVEIVRPQTPTAPSTTTTPSSAPTPNPLVSAPSPSAPSAPSIFVPTPQASLPTVSPDMPTSSNANPIPVRPIGLVDAANSYSRAKLPNQTAAIQNLQANVAPEILQQFFERWQTASGQVPSSLVDALSSYNVLQASSQELALQWLQKQLLPQTIDSFRQDWANLNSGGGFTTTGSPFTPSPTTDATPISTLQLINLTSAVKVFDRAKYPNQVTALEKLQAAIPDQTLQQFFQRWSIASQQNTLAISLVDVFQDYEDYTYPSQVTALKWLEKEITNAQLEQFSRDWQA